MLSHEKNPASHFHSSMLRKNKFSGTPRSGWAPGTVTNGQFPPHAFGLKKKPEARRSIISKFPLTKYVTLERGGAQRFFL